MDVLSVIHGSNARSGVFGEAVRERGHRLDEWSLAWGDPLPLPLDSYGAVLVFGGAMHADQDDRHPWLREENLFIQRLLDQHVPLFGVCLGHQAIGQVFGGRVVRAPAPVHGKPARITHDGRTIFAGLTQGFQAGRYHSLIVERATLPGCLEVSATTPDGLIMAVRHRELPVEGVQFHPESIITPEGKRLLENFLNH